MTKEVSISKTWTKVASGPCLISKLSTSDVFLMNFGMTIPLSDARNFHVLSKSDTVYHGDENVYIRVNSSENTKAIVTNINNSDLERFLGF